MINRFWVKCVAALLVGFACLGKSFAYWGVPAAKIFIGDIFLALSILLKPRAVVGRWLYALIQGGPLNGFAWMLLMFFQYGIITAIRGFSKDYDPIVILQELIFNIYPLYLFLGIEVGIRSPDFLRKIIRVQAWCTGIYGTAYIIVLNRLDIFIPGTKVPVFGQTGGGLAIIALLCLERRLRLVWIPLCLNAFLMLGMQVRAEWVGFIIGVSLWGVLTGQLKRLAIGMFLVAALLLVGYATDFSMPSPRSRGGTISTRDIIGRMIASVDPEAAAQFTDRAQSYGGTVAWRRNWWQAIWNSSLQDAETIAFGHGYGFRITNLVSYLAGEDIRTPHNDFFYALAYTGWLGTLIFYSFLLAILRMLWRVFRLTGQPIGVITFGTALASSFFGNMFETPFGAIPLYLLFGIAIAPLLVTKPRPAAVASGITIPARPIGTSVPVWTMSRS
jgi:hypothetical protein